ncbi:carbonic anhydrase [Aquimarina macrocephali]|uniref:carbonic anhydrase n=1 Tax=Aquimarina macrocephali TaxID=666563 RepID=UPI000464929E|nr:carbonic anhydrase family protein [Aquimarina macrocephali]
MKINKLKTLLVLAIGTVIISCENEQTENLDLNQDVKDEMIIDYLTGRKSSSDCHFEYEGVEGPEFWDSLCSGAWTDCGGNTQSPINIEDSSAIENQGLGDIATSFGSSTTEIVNNGHTIKFIYNSGSTSTINGITYTLKQFHLHTGSEHTVDGVRSPMEAHLVHQDPITGDLAVIGIFFEEGAENEMLSNFMNDLPVNGGGHYNSSFTFNVEDILPADMNYYTYNGSLTTPPCSEIVTWYVLKNPVEASQEQLHSFETIMHENFRPVQALNGRVVSTNNN